MLENDEPIDFLDVSTAKGVTSKDPSKKKSKPRDDYEEDDIEYDDDGKMIINDSDEEQQPKKKKEKDFTFEELLDEQAREFEKRQRKVKEYT